MIPRLSLPQDGTTDLFQNGPVLPIRFKHSRGNRGSQSNVPTSGIEIPSPTERFGGHQHRSPSRLFSCAATIGAAAFVRMAEDIPSNQAALCQLHGGLKYSLFFLALFTSIYQCMHLARRIQFTTVDEAGFAVCKCCISRFSVGFLPIPWTLKICQVMDIMKPQSAAGMPLIIEGSELIEALALTSN